MAAWKENVGFLLILFPTFLFTEWCWQGVERRSAAKIIYDPDPTSDHP